LYENRSGEPPAGVMKHTCIMSPMMTSLDKDDYFKDKAIGHSETLKFDFDGHPFFIHCTKGLFLFVL